jgi:hypothetical protein
MVKKDAGGGDDDRWACFHKFVVSSKKKFPRVSKKAVKVQQKIP